MKLYLAIDPMYIGTYWCNQYVKGIRYEVLQNNRTLHEISLSELESYQDGPSNLIMLLSNSRSWFPQAVEAVAQKGWQIVLVSPFMDFVGTNVSYVCADLHAMVRDTCAYMRSHGKNRVALFGWLSDSTGDAVKRSAFEEFFHGHKACRVFENEGNMEKACERFYQQYSEFDAVLCCNDVAGIKLMKYLTQRGVRIPQSIWLCAIGDATVSKLIKPSITTAVLDCVSIGRQAVKLCLMLAKSPIITTVSATVAGLVEVRESTGFALLAQTGHMAPAVSQLENISKFYSDETVKDIFDLEMLVNHCTNADFEILRLIRDGYNYNRISERMFISESTIKYRLKRMCNLAGRKTREEVVLLVGDYLDLDHVVNPQPKG